MEKALSRLSEENLRSTKFLHPSSYNKVSKECQARLVEDYLQFLHSECKELIKNEVKHGKNNFKNLMTLNHVPQTKFKI
jgi:cullin 2